MRLTLLPLVMIVNLPTACGGDDSGDDSGTSSTTQTPTTTPPTTTPPPTAPSSTSGADTTGDPADSEPLPTSGPTEADTTGGPIPNDEYIARFLGSGESSILIRKRDMAADLCTTIYVRELGTPMGYGGMWPGEYVVQTAYITQHADTCFDLSMAAVDPVDASTVSGTGYWEPAFAYCPEDGITIDLTVTFFSDQPWVPSEVTMNAMALDAMCV